MSDDAIVYTINLIIGVILAGVMSSQRQLESNGPSWPTWIAAAWTFTGADLLFVLRAEYATLVPRLLPALAVTSGHLLLLLAAQRTGGRRPALPVAGVVLVVHAALQVGFWLAPEFSAWRSVTNGIIWGALSVVTALALRSSDERVRTVMTLPAAVLVLHGVFHVGRTGLAIRAAFHPEGNTAPLVQLLGDLEVSLFMVALFVSVLVAFLQLSNAELRAARDSVRELSAMLPLCAWCHKVRDDAGYWQRLEEYLAVHRINVTHGMCESCAADHLAHDRAVTPDRSERIVDR